PSPTMSAIAVKARTALALGLPNLARALVYRSGVKLGLNPVRRLSASIPNGPYFLFPQIEQSLLPGRPIGWTGTATQFGYSIFKISDSPLPWHVNPINGGSVKNPNRDWWEIPDFDPEVGDIKTIWEASRFDWVLAYAQQTATGDQ